jgi:tetratricopeptide (TPR) repeat protein
MNYRKINNLTGWITFAIAYVVYLMTMERTVSFWDCGEFLSCAYKLEVGHSPGAPMFAMLQRIFALFAGGGAATGQASTTAAMYINSFSALTSGLTILFLFWTITHYAKKLMVGNNGTPDKNQTLMIMGAGLVGGLCYTFSDTFWFSAVEAEVYATSSLFTALTFWAMLKWELVADEKHADRWIVLIAFLLGISVCIHLLNLLTIPTLAMIYYYRKYEPTLRGSILAFLAGCFILALVQFGVIQYIPRIASWFDIQFVNGLGTAFDVGSVTFLLLLVGLLVFLLMFAKRRGMYLLHISVLCITFIIIGYSAYFSAIIRSRADVPIDMTNPDNPITFLDYVSREQFGQQPLFTGPYFTSQYSDVKEKGKQYAQAQENGKDHYVEVGKKLEPVYSGDQSHFFPRVWDGNDANHANFYRQWLGLGPNDDPTTKDNISFFLGYQMNWMWWRYFMWNYAGRQNDIEGQGNAQNGNWISGIGFVDKMRGLGDTDSMGDGISRNGAQNKLYFLPFILGILGIIFQFNRNKRDGIVILSLFFFTGAAIGIYLNMPPLQPRERDYAFAGATYTFAIWIGLGVLMVHQWFRKLANNQMAAFGSIALCLVAVPTLMAKEEWDDHDRSKKRLAHDAAYNTLMCCAPNAVLFTFGDNQTYPLWYAQEIEGYRRDVRIINTSLLGIDWYIDQLNYRTNDADAVPMIWTKWDYMGDKHNIVGYYDNPALKIPADRYYNLVDICKFINSNDPSKEVNNRGGELMNYIPTKNFFAATPSKEQLVKMGMVKAEDTARISGEMKWTFPKSSAYKSDLAILNIIAGVASDGWKRPLYFDAGLRQGDYGGTGDYLHMEGLVYRLMPFKYNDSIKVNQQVLGTINTAKGYDLFMKFTFGGGERNDVYFDEPNRHEFVTYRMDASFLANQLSAEGKKNEAIQVLDKVMNGITEHSYSYDYTAYFVASAYYRAGAKEKAAALSKKIVRNAEDNVNWMSTLTGSDRNSMAGEAQQQFQIMQSIGQVAYQSGDTTTAQQIIGKLQALSGKVKDLISTRNMPSGGGEEE